MEDKPDILSCFKTLLMTSFAENSQIEQEVVTEEETKTLEGLVPIEVYENLNILIKDLLNYKRSYFSSKKSLLLNQVVQFEQNIQKLEAEVREHIRTEQQLRLYIEKVQLKLEKSKFMIQEYQYLLNKNPNFDTQTNTECNPTHKRYRHISHRRQMTESKSKDYQEYFRKLKQAFDAKQRECHNLQRTNEGMIRKIIYYKKEEARKKNLSDRRAPSIQKSNSLSTIRNSHSRKRHPSVKSNIRGSIL